MRVEEVLLALKFPEPLALLWQPHADVVQKGVVTAAAAHPRFASDTHYTHHTSIHQQSAHPWLCAGRSLLAHQVVDGELADTPNLVQSLVCVPQLVELLGT